MNILLLSYIMNACCVKLRYHKMHTHTHTHTHTYIIEWKMIEVPKIYIYIYIYYIMIFINTLKFKAQLITCI